MKEYIDNFLRYMSVERGASEHTLRAYEKDLRLLDEFIGKDIKEVDLFDIRGYVAEQAGKRLSKTTVSRRLATARSFFKYLHREGVIESNPSRLVSSPKLPKRLPKFLSIDDVFQLIENVDGIGLLPTRDRVILEMFYSCGIRVSELVGLNMDDFNIKQRMMKVRGKGKKERIVPLGAKTIYTLKAYIIERLLIKKAKKVVDGEALFVNRSGKRITDRSVRRVVVKFARAIGIEGNIGPHTLRHTFATHLLQGGADLRIIQELLGHSSLSTTQKYTHLDIKHLMDVYDKSHPLAELQIED